MFLPILLFILLLAPLLWVMVRGKDAWPFSHYPMFSRLTNLSEVVVLRVALETTGGEVVWWGSEFYRYPEFVGIWLKRTQQMEGEGGRSAALASLERQRCLAEVLRLIETAGGRLDQYQALLIVRRSVADGNGITIRDQTVSRIPLAGIKRIRRAD
jgi:hypothetical protein